jgi:hypothetical protein
MTQITEHQCITVTIFSVTKLLMFSSASLQEIVQLYLVICDYTTDQIQ